MQNPCVELLFVCVGNFRGGEGVVDGQCLSYRGPTPLLLDDQVGVERRPDAPVRDVGPTLEIGVHALLPLFH